MTTPQALELVATERSNQDTKWGEQNHNADHWLVILGEEVGEACEASLNNDIASLEQELLQVAAVAVAAIESLRRNT